MINTIIISMFQYKHYYCLSELLLNYNIEMLSQFVFDKWFRVSSNVQLK